MRFIVRDIMPVIFIKEYYVDVIRFLSFCLTRLITSSVETEGKEKYPSVVDFNMERPSVVCCLITVRLQCPLHSINV